MLPPRIAFCITAFLHSILRVSHVCIPARARKHIA